MKYFFIDIDNTLTKFLRSVSDENLKALSYVLNHGDQVVLCSGRSSASCENIKKTIEEYAKKQMKYGIFSNGGYIVDFSTNQITTNLIPNDTV
jgi:hydroxymethylpyrimidine pyrophosphatase-like HAD family hydrolase